MNQSRLLLSVSLCAWILTGCGYLGLDDGEAPPAVAGEEDAGQYVSLIVKDRYGFRIKDPLGKRITGGTCGIWKDNREERSGECCWNARTECSCPCPER